MMSEMSDVMFEMMISGYEDEWQHHMLLSRGEEREGTTKNKRKKEQNIREEEKTERYKQQTRPI